MATAIAPQLILAQPANPASNNTAANTAKADSAANGSPAFATVLQQKSSAAAPQQQAKQVDTSKPQATQNNDAAADSKTAELNASTLQTQATDIASLLPWLNTTQTNTAQITPTPTVAADTTTTNETQDIQTLTLLQGQQVAVTLAGQNQPKNPVVENNSKSDAEQTKDTGLFGQNGNKQPSVLAALTDNTANVAVSEDARTLVETQSNSQQSVENFEAALTNARAGMAAQTEQVNPQHNKNQSDVPSLHTEATVGSRTWNNEVGEHIRWMASSNESKAEIVLNPPQLGRVEVSLSIKGDQAEASFVSANPQVREALEGAMSRLREVLADSGISLGQAHVGAESRFAQQQQQQPASSQSASGRQPESSDSVSIAQTGSSSKPILMQQGLGMVDTFA